MPNGFFSSSIYPLVILSGIPKDSISLQSDIESHIKSMEGLMGPELFEGTNVWKFVAENGLHNLDADILILTKFTEISISRDPDSGFVGIQAITPSVASEALLEQPFAVEVFKHISTLLEDPTLWLFICSNEDMYSERPFSVHFKKILEPDDLQINFDDVEVSSSDIGTPVVKVNGMQSMMDYITPYSKDLQSDLSNLFANKDISDKDLLSTLKKVISIPGEVINLFEMENGPMSRIFSMTYEALKVNIAKRSQAMTDLYNNFLDKYPYFGMPIIKYPSVSVTYMSSSFDLIKATVEIELMDDEDIDFTKDDRVNSSVSSRDEFFR